MLLIYCQNVYFVTEEPLEMPEFFSDGWYLTSLNDQLVLIT